MQPHLKTKLRQLPNKPGIYRMLDAHGVTVYVGKAKNLKKRVSTYFQAARRSQLVQVKIRALIEQINDFEIQTVASESEALLLENQLIKKYKPRYNTDLTDDKQFLMIRLDPRETLPRFCLTRNRTDRHARYYGPFAHSSQLRTTLTELRRKFGILLQDAKPKRLKNDRWQLYADLRAELFPHPNEVTQETYQKRLEQACHFLDGKSVEWLGELKSQMQAAADQRNYEVAARLRDRITALELTVKRTRKFERNQTHQIASIRSVASLQACLNLSEPPDTMECFDISHISGSFCVASMVQFRQGRPERKHYRRYKIQSFVGNDDFRAMQEVVGRRYLRLMKEHKPYPDLVVIDGGLGQVSSALRAFMEHQLPLPNLIGLAKKNETIIFSDGREPLQLEHHHPALRLLQYIRDEAHHFANAFNAELRSKRLKESILDQFEGLGTSRKQALLHHFGTIEKLQSAELQQLTEVKGIGPIIAKNLLKFLRATRPSSKTDCPQIPSQQ